MSKFKKGDRVRARRTIGDFFTKGSVYEIASDNGRGNYVLTDNNKPRVADAEHHTDSAWLADNFELVADKFKPGDRVRLTDDNEGWGEKGATGTVVSKNGDDWLVNFDEEFRGGSKWYARNDNLELIPTLRIEAGKFYKTRDGRKVGPMELYLDEDGARDSWSAVGDEQGRLWGADGTRYYGGNKETDLIAEWVEPVATATATTTDAAAKPKFKVGDRVNTSGGFSFDPAIGTVASVDADEESEDYYLVDVDGEGNWGYYERELTAITPTNTAIVCVLRDGKPLPASHPHVHHSVEEAKAEAERLARLKPGDTFAVYERVSSVSATVTLSEAA